MNPEADFHIPFDGGMLPMKVIRFEVADNSDPLFREVRVSVEAVSIGAPVPPEPEMRTFPEIGS